MQNVRHLDKLIDELAKGKAMEKFLNAVLASVCATHARAVKSFGSEIAHQSRGQLGA